MGPEKPIVLRSGVRNEREGFGHLLTPNSGAHKTSAVGQWACDNDCFNEFNPSAYLRMLNDVRDREGCLFVTCPDEMADWNKTLKLFQEWSPVIKSHDLPIALVLQDGLDIHTIPWDRIQAVFIGGTTEFKLSHHVASVSGYARAYGKWVHMGRVNSKKRYHYAHSIGCQSVDGSTFSWFPDTGEVRLDKWKDQERFWFS